MRTNLYTSPTRQAYRLLSPFRVDCSHWVRAQKRYPWRRGHHRPANGAFSAMRQFSCCNRAPRNLPRLHLRDDSALSFLRYSKPSHTPYSHSIVPLPRKALFLFLKSLKTAPLFPSDLPSKIRTVDFIEKFRALENFFYRRLSAAVSTSPLRFAPRVNSERPKRPVQLPVLGKERRLVAQMRSRWRGEWVW